jgi:pectinesterase
VTALGRDSETNPAFYLFNNCQVAAAPGEQPPVGRYYLGRPWRSFARVVFQSTEMSDVVNPAGWTVWWAGDSPDDLEFGEYNNSGPGSVGPRASFTQRLAAPVEIGTVLDNHASWVDPAFL